MMHRRNDGSQTQKSGMKKHQKSIEQPLNGMGIRKPGLSGTFFPGGKDVGQQVDRFNVHVTPPNAEDSAFYRGRSHVRVHQAERRPSSRQIKSTTQTSMEELLELR